MLKTASASLALGCLAGLGFAPLHWSLLALIAYPCLYRLMFPPTALAGKALAVKATKIACAFYFGNYFVSLFWVAEAPAHSDPSLFWVGIMFMFLLPVILALFMALAVFVAGFVKGNAPRMLILIAGLAAMEFARGNLFTGFTWNMPAHLILNSSELLQNASWSGLYGTNLLVLLILILPASLFYHGRKAFIGCGISLAFLICGFAYGWWKLGVEIPQNEAYGVRLVQPNLRGEERWRRDNILNNFKLHLQMSIKDRPDWVRTVIWAESSVPFDFTKYEELLDVAKTIIPENGKLITGVVHTDDAETTFYTSMFGIDKSGEVDFIYRKHHLVPFGEYIPFYGYLPLPALAARGNHFSSGEAPTTLKFANIPSFIPLICYEIIFPYLRNNAYEKGAKFILNISNDEWYKPDITKINIGFHQHFQLSRFAAVESGLPVVRGTVTGISAVIDAQGRIIASLPYNERGVIDALIPPSQPSFALLYGNLIFLALFGILLLAIAMLFLYDKKTNPKSE